MDEELIRAPAPPLILLPISSCIIKRGDGEPGRRREKLQIIDYSIPLMSLAAQGWINKLLFLILTQD